MNQNRETIINDFLTNKFSTERFIALLREMFPQTQFARGEKHPFESEQNGGLISFTALCKPLQMGLFKIGVGVFETTSIRAKITIHTKLRDLLKNSSLNGILCVFYEPQNAQNPAAGKPNSNLSGAGEFRLSLLTNGYDFATNKTIYSDLKRHSFILGHDKIATARAALARLAARAAAAPLTLDDLQEAFSQDSLNADFYKGYKEHFELICAKLEGAKFDNIFAHITTNALNSTDKAADRKRIEAFAKKLLGRIVFLYFLQKKGWLGVAAGADYGTGQRDFIHRQFKIAVQKGENFYLDRLRPLFFESLNKNREGDYSPHFECKIPFLNGGLFEDEFATKIANDTIKQHALIAETLDNAVFKNLLDFLDAYNFTLEESSPQDIEISIDPEMLGKVFENLIDYNKQSGAFYTPREIVSYMAQSAILAYLQRHFAGGANELESLIYHFESDNDFIRKNAAAIKDALLGVKILDPAIGSGAFPMGVLLEIMQILTTLDKTLTNHDKAALKRRLIQECIYGLDIDADAIDIARLRFWLSIAVDEAAPQPLPNLDFKFMQGNSLLETLCGQKIISNLDEPHAAQEDLFGNYDIKELQRVSLFDKRKSDELAGHFKEYFTQNDPAKKRALKRRILEIMREFFERNIRAAQDAVRDEEKWIDYALGSGKRAKEIATHQAKIQQHKDYATALRGLLADYERNNFASESLFLYGFFFASVMDGGGFDIVIGNPPYIRQEKIPQKAAILAAFKPSGFANSTADIYTYFFAKGLEVLRAGGVLSFITSNKFTRAGYGANLRTLLLRHEITHFIDLNGVKVFDNATVDTAITSVRKVAANSVNSLPNSAKNSQNSATNGANSNLTAAAAQNATINSTTPTATSAQNAITYLPLNSFADFTKTSHIADFLPRASAVPQATLTPAAFIFAASDTLALKSKIEQLGTPLKEWDIAINYGIKTGYNDAFIIDTATKDEILRGCADDDERERTAALIKPILRGRDIKRYSYEWAGLWLINTHNGYEFNGAKLPPIDIADYPALKAFLDDFYPQLAKRADKGVTPYNLRNCAYIGDFEKEKIVWTDMAQKSSFFWDDNKMFLNNTCYFITNANKYILAVLNSKIMSFYLQQIASGLGEGAFRWFKQYVEKLPIPKITPQNQAIAEQIVHLVEQILQSKKQGKDTSEFESQINSAVYALYDLTAAEIALIAKK